MIAFDVKERHAAWPSLSYTVRRKCGFEGVAGSGVDPRPAPSFVSRMASIVLSPTHTSIRGRAEPRATEEPTPCYEA